MLRAMSARRFVILCLGRTGSSHLVDLLDSHPRVRCFAEILNETHPKAAPEGWIGDSGTEDAGRHVPALLASAESPAAGPAPLAVGFKLPQNSFADHPEIRTWLEASPDVTVIRLRRRNLLALLVSRRLVRATLVSQSLYGTYGDAQVEIAPKEALRALERIEAEEAELDRLAAGHPVLEIDYGELGEEAALKRLQRGLGVEPQPLRSRYERLRTRPLAETISNWDELASGLRETRFAPLLAGDG